METVILKERQLFQVHHFQLHMVSFRNINQCMNIFLTVSCYPCSAATTCNKKVKLSLIQCFYAGYEGYPPFSQPLPIQPAQHQSSYLMMRPYQWPIGQQMLPPDQQPSTSQARYLPCPSSCLEHSLCHHSPVHIPKQTPAAVQTVQEEVTGQLQNTLPCQLTLQEVKNSGGCQMNATPNPNHPNPNPEERTSTKKMSDILLKGECYNIHSSANTSHTLSHRKLNKVLPLLRYCENFVYMHCIYTYIVSGSVDTIKKHRLKAHLPSTFGNIVALGKYFPPCEMFLIIVCINIYYNA